MQGLGNLFPTLIIGLVFSDARRRLSWGYQFILLSAIMVKILLSLPGICACREF